jgi:transposase
LAFPTGLGEVGGVHRARTQYSGTRGVEQLVARGRTAERRVPAFPGLAVFLSSQPKRILAYSVAVDMRKSFNGLVALVQNVLQEDPLSDCLFVFFNRRGNYLKLVTWDRTGYCLFAKRLEQGRFRLPSSKAKQELSERAFRLILDGIVLGNRRRVC